MQAVYDEFQTITSGAHTALSSLEPLDLNQTHGPSLRYEWVLLFDAVTSSGFVAWRVLAWLNLA